MHCTVYTLLISCVTICSVAVTSTVMEGSENSGDATALGDTFFTTKDGTSYVLEGI